MPSDRTARHPHPDPEAVVRDFLSCFGSFAAYRAGCVHHLADDCVCVSSGLPPVVGKAAILELVDRSHSLFGEYELHVEIHRVAARGETVFVERTDRGTGPDGQPLTAHEMVGVFDVREGLITSWHNYFDPRSLIDRLDAARAERDAI